MLINGALRRKFVSRTDRGICSALGRGESVASALALAAQAADIVSNALQEYALKSQIRWTEEQANETLKNEDLPRRPLLVDLINHGGDESPHRSRESLGRKTGASREDGRPHGRWRLAGMVPD